MRSSGHAVKDPDADLQVVVPTLSFRTPEGRLNLDATRRYAEQAVETWIDTFMLSGSTTRGDLLTVAERAVILDLWLNLADPSRLLASCWCPEDLGEAERRGIRPIAVMRDLQDQNEALAFLGGLPPGAYVYSHPMYTTTGLDGDLAAAARYQGTLPAGAKIAKISVEQIAALREAAGPAFSLWHGSSRHIRSSVEAGASGVVATPMTVLPTPFPTRVVEDIQATIDRIQAVLDRLLTRKERLAQLTSMANEAISA
jgi:dihydrodipicolinate synthase/N-acetylneuraminate lyase